MADLRALLFPRSVALVGATPRREKTVVMTLRSGVTAYGVSPARDEVAGMRCYPAISDLPEVPEAAFLLVGHHRVESAFEEAAAIGVRSFVVPGLGVEAGEEARPVVARLAARARELDAAMMGPNCMGFSSPGVASAWLGKPLTDPAPGHVAAVCQSGSIADALISLGGRVGFRTIVSSGGEAVTDVADYLAFLAREDGTRAVGLFLEAARRPEAFLAGLEACAEAGKPVVCLKVGRSEAAAQAALSHTGALVGSQAVFSAALRACGAIEVDDFHELIETLEVLGRRRWPRGTRLAGISESGGECALLADQAEAAGVPFEPLPDGVTAELTSAFPNFVAPGNTLDVWAVADEMDVIPRSLEILAASGRYDVLLGLVDLAVARDVENEPWLELTMRSLARVTEATDMFPAVVSVHSGDPPRHLHELSRELDLALLRGPRDGIRAIANVARWGPRPSAPASSLLPPVEIADLVAGRTGALPELESAAVLARYGIPFAPHGRAATPDEAARLAAELGAPVAVKRDGDAHKSRSGGVVLGVRDPEEAAAAAARLGCPVLVARQVPAGPEVMVGMTRDAGYGPVVAVGRGGVDVEQLGDVALALAPLDLEGARRLVAEARIPDGDGVVAAALVAVGRLAAEHPRIASVDVNPLVLAGRDTVAVDALVVLQSDPDISNERHAHE